MLYYNTDLENFYYENTKNNSSKFWAITISEEQNYFTVTRKWGIIGQNGTTMVEKFNSYSLAKAHHIKLVIEKTAKGYKPIM